MDDFIGKCPRRSCICTWKARWSRRRCTNSTLDTGGRVPRAYRYADFDAFLKAFAVIGKRLRTPQDYALITRRLLERLAAQNVRYAEIIVSAGVVLWKGQEFAPIFDAIHDAAADSPVEVQLDTRCGPAVRRGAGDAGGETGGGAGGPRRGGVRNRRQ
jgi:hypothetical protein